MIYFRNRVWKNGFSSNKQYLKVMDTPKNLLLINYLEIFQILKTKIINIGISVFSTILIKEKVHNS